MFGNNINRAEILARETCRRSGRNFTREERENENDISFPGDKAPEKPDGRRVQTRARTLCRVQGCVEKACV